MSSRRAPSRHSAAAACNNASFGGDWTKPATVPGVLHDEPAKGSRVSMIKRASAQCVAKLAKQRLPVGGRYRQRRYEIPEAVRCSSRRIHLAAIGRRASAIRACPREDATTSHGGGSMPTSVRTAAPDITVNALCMFGDFSKFLLVSCRSGGHDRPGSLYDSYGFSPDAAIDPSTADSEDGSAWRHELDMTVDALTCMNRGVSYGYNRRDTRGRPA